MHSIDKIYTQLSRKAFRWLFVTVPILELAWRETSQFWTVSLCLFRIACVREKKQKHYSWMLLLDLGIVSKVLIWHLGWKDPAPKMDIGRISDRTALEERAILLKSPICEHSMRSFLYWHYCPGRIWPEIWSSNNMTSFYNSALDDFKWGGRHFRIRRLHNMDKISHEITAYEIINAFMAIRAGNFYIESSRCDGLILN